MSTVIPLEIASFKMGDNKIEIRYSKCESMAKLFRLCESISSSYFTRSLG